MTSPNVSAVEPTPGTLIEAAYPTPDYRDAFVIGSTQGLTVEQFATGFFLCQPKWLALVSMNLPGKAARREAIGDGQYPDGSNVGSWKIFGRADNEIMFGDHMGFMEYRFSLFERSDGQIEASTSVQYANRFAPIYFNIVKPFHVGFTKVALGNGARHAATVSREACPA